MCVDILEENSVLHRLTEERRGLEMEIRAVLIS